MCGSGAMTTTKRRFGLGTLIVVLLVAAAGVAAMRGTWEGLGRRVGTAGSDELITFFAKWTPSPREEDVMIVLTTTGILPAVKQKNSPFVHDAMLPPGTPVRIVVVQEKGGGYLECRIRRGLRTLAQQDNKVLNGPSVFCETVT